MMKNTYTIAQRNALVEAHLSCIDAVLRRNRRLIRDARLEPDDVYQQLALRLITAVANYDSSKGPLEKHIQAQLQYELVNCLSPKRRFGVSEAPGDFGGKLVSFEAYRNRAAQREMGMAA